MAGRRLARERPGATLEPTALVNDLYVRFVENRPTSLQDTAHFKAVASVAMWRVLVDHARRRGPLRNRVDLTLDSMTAPVNVSWDKCLEIERALEKLEKSVRNGPRIAEQVRYRYGGGMTEEEIAACLGISDRQLRRDWTFARVWLLREAGP